MYIGLKTKLLTLGSGHRDVQAGKFYLDPTNIVAAFRVDQVCVVSWLQ